MDILPMAVQRAASRYLDYWHGYGDEHQYRYYRCEGCDRLITHKRIRTGGCGCGRSVKLRPAVLSRRDMARCLFAPWSLAR